MNQFQIPIRPQATPTNQFYQPRPDTQALMAGDKSLQLANALLGIRPELQRIVDQRSAMYQGQEMATAEQQANEAMASQNKAEFMKKVKAGELDQADNPWFTVAIRQAVAKQDVQDLHQTVWNEYQKDPIQFEDDAPKVEQWLSKRLAPALNDPDPWSGRIKSEGAAAIRNQFLQNHAEKRRAERKTEGAEAFRTTVKSITANFLQDDPFVFHDIANGDVAAVLKKDQLRQRLQALTDAQVTVMPAAEVNQIFMQALGTAAQENPDLAEDIIDLIDGITTKEGASIGNTATATQWKLDAKLNLKYIANRQRSYAGDADKEELKVLGDKLGDEWLKQVQAFGPGITPEQLASVQIDMSGLTSEQYLIVSQRIEALKQLERGKLEERVGAKVAEELKTGTLTRDSSLSYASSFAALGDRNGTSWVQTLATRSDRTTTDDDVRIQLADLLTADVFNLEQYKDVLRGSRHLIADGDFSQLLNSGYQKAAQDKAGGLGYSVSDARDLLVDQINEARNRRNEQPLSLNGEGGIGGIPASPELNRAAHILREEMIRMSLDPAIIALPLKERMAKVREAVDTVSLSNRGLTSDQYLTSAKLPEPAIPPLPVVKPVDQAAADKTAAKAKERERKLQEQRDAGAELDPLLLTNDPVLNGWEGVKNRVKEVLSDPAYGNSGRFQNPSDHKRYARTSNATTLRNIYSPSQDEKDRNDQAFQLEALIRLREINADPSQATDGTKQEEAALYQSLKQRASYMQAGAEASLKELEELLSLPITADTHFRIKELGKNLLVYAYLRQAAGYTLDEVKAMGPDAWQTIPLFSGIDDFNKRGEEVFKQLNLPEGESFNFSNRQQTLLQKRQQVK